MTVQSVDVEAINLGQRKALLNNGAIVALTNLLDEDGEETDDPSEASAFVCSYNGLWYSGSVNDFNPASTRH